MFRVPSSPLNRHGVHRVPAADPQRFKAHRTALASPAPPFTNATTRELAIGLILWLIVSIASLLAVRATL